ncbi:hypothetical protein TNCV_3627491 [Trichonephila clavipes]|nr:hypothetical protein TNCV_3627491 [Trichonephila clavipes]
MTPELAPPSSNFRARPTEGLLGPKDTSRISGRLFGSSAALSLLEDMTIHGDVTRNKEQPLLPDSNTRGSRT